MAPAVISQRIRQIRKKRKMTRDELAELCDVHRQTIWRWETGKGAVKADDVPMIARALGVSIIALYRKS